MFRVHMCSALQVTVTVRESYMEGQGDLVRLAWGELDKKMIILHTLGGPGTCK